MHGLHLTADDALRMFRLLEQALDVIAFLNSQQQVGKSRADQIISVLSEWRTEREAAELLNLPYSAVHTRVHYIKRTRKDVRVLSRGERPNVEKRIVPVSA